ncbi:MAG: M42 family peptidase [Clostridia bacterium]|nr:M42 family peptidase [Clostridia bacterium]
MNSIDLIRALSVARGVPGFEDEVVEVIRKHADPALGIWEDSLRNVYLKDRDQSEHLPVIQLDAHSDEVGFMVHSIRENGTLKFAPLGGWVASNIPAHRVWVQTACGRYIPGITAAKPPHFMSEAEKRAMPEISDMSIDIGATSLEEARDVFGIRVGAPVVPHVTFEYDEPHDLMFGKAFDNRLGCAAVLETMRRLKGEELQVRPVGAIASQEEVGTRGASVTARRVKPDIAIVFEGCPADDTVVPSAEVQTAIHRGPMLRHLDARMITNPRYQRFTLDLAASLGIPCQEAVRTGGSTNGAPIHLSNLGVPVIVIGFPVRYIHSHWGIASLKDFEYGVELACQVIRRLNRGIIESF